MKNSFKIIWNVLCRTVLFRACVILTLIRRLWKRYFLFIFDYRLKMIQNYVFGREKNCIWPENYRQGRREGGQGGKMTRGPWTLGGPWVSGRPLASAGPAEGPWTREGAYRNDTEKSAWCEAWRPFFSFLEITNFWPEKPLKYWWRPLFFWDHIIFRKKLQHFLLFWTSQNRKSVIFELAPGPLLVPGGTDYRTPSS